MSQAKAMTTTNDFYTPVFSSGPGRKLNHTRFRTSGNGIAGDPGEKGYLIRIALSNPADIPPLPYKSPSTVTLSYEPPPPSFSTAAPLPVPPAVKVPNTLYVDDEPYPDEPVGPYSGTRTVATGTEPLWPYRQGNNLVAINQMGDVLSTLALDADDLKTEPVFTTVYNPTLSGASASAVSGPGPLTGMSQNFAADNNYTCNYTDLWAEYLKNLNKAPDLSADPSYDPKADWRNPQSDWPRLIRIRLRLHDRQGLVTSYSDEALINGRDDDGDGRVDNPEEGRISGIWFEYVFSVPYPHDPAPRNH